MPQKVHWSEPADAQLRRMRAAGATWDAIANALRLSRSAVREHGRRIGAPRPRVPQMRAADRVRLVPWREPLPAGHPLSWGLITAGTLLEDSRYPLPAWREREFY